MLAAAFTSFKEMKLTKKWFFQVLIVLIVGKITSTRIIVSHFGGTYTPATTTAPLSAPTGTSCTSSLRKRQDGSTCEEDTPTDEPAPTCFDGIQNQGETGVDCGGPCSSCSTCNDGILNGGEDGVDCGLVCGSLCPLLMDCIPIDSVGPSVPFTFNAISLGIIPACDLSQDPIIIS